MWRLFTRSLWRAPRRVVLAAIGVAFPVAVLASTLLFIDHAVNSMTPAALAPVQVEMRAAASSLTVDMPAVNTKLAAVKGVKRVDRFAAADVVVSIPGKPGNVTARLFAIDAEYLIHHPWVKVASGSLGNGVLLGQPLQALPGFDQATTVNIELPVDPAAEAPAPLVPLKVGGAVDLRQARTWFEVPFGDMQGDIAVVPRTLVIDYATFERSVLPALRKAAGNESTVLNQGNTDLPAVSLETHISVDHSSYPNDPAQAWQWSTALRRVLERQEPGAIGVADNAADLLNKAREDATNAKILFLLLGIPGALVAAGIGLAAASALAEAHRREEALLQLRGATSGQIVRLTAAHAAVSSVIGAAIGLVVAGFAIRAVTGRQVWRDVPIDRLSVSAGIAIGAGVLMTAIRLIPLIRAGKRSEVVLQRRNLESGWSPTLRGARLDLILLGIGILILGINVVSGGLRQSQVEGQTLALAFYVLLAPILIWVGATMLVIRAMFTLLIRRTRPDRPRRLGTWTATALRWLGRRPARTGAAVILGALAIAFGTNVVTFVATYDAAKQADVQAAFGSHLRLTPNAEPGAALPQLGSDVTATSPVRIVPARVGTDRKNIQTIDIASYQKAVTVAPRIIDGSGVEALVSNPKAILVHAEIADGFSVKPGDMLTVTIFPDDKSRTQNLSLQVAGVYRSFPPTDPFAEIVMTTGALPQTPALPVPDFYLAKTAAGSSDTKVAADIRGRAPNLTVQTVADMVLQEKRSLTALDLRGLAMLETIAAGSIAAVGVAVLGAFLVLERRRESAILQAIGATTRQVLTAPVVEGTVAVLGSLAVGIPIGIGLSMLGIRVLGLFFTLPPPLVVVPVATLAELAGFMAAVSLVAFGFTLRTVASRAAASVLREP